MFAPAIQLHTLRNVDRPVADLVDLVAEVGFEGVEFAYRLPDADPDAVVERLDTRDLDVVGAHVPIHDLEDDFEETVALYERLGCTDIVPTYIGDEWVESRTAVEVLAERLDDLEAALGDRGIATHYHNHDHEFAALDGETAFDAFVDATDVGIEYDVAHGMAAGRDPIADLRSLGERSKLVHVTDFDVDAGEYVVVGDGDLDLQRLAAAATDNDTDWLVYEYEGEDPLDSLERAAETIQGLCR